ncbi:MAG TPA: hypothetical protein VGD78_17465 [Chthoniobacterales bacterium]
MKLFNWHVPGTWDLSKSQEIQSLRNENEQLIRQSQRRAEAHAQEVRQLQEALADGRAAASMDGIWRQRYNEASQEVLDLKNQVPYQLRERDHGFVAYHAASFVDAYQEKARRDDLNEQAYEAGEEWNAGPELEMWERQTDGTYRAMTDEEIAFKREGLFLCRRIEALQAVVDELAQQRDGLVQELERAKQNNQALTLEMQTAGGQEREQNQEACHTLILSKYQADLVAEAIHYGAGELAQYADGHGRDIDGVHTHMDCLGDVERQLLRFARSPALNVSEKAEVLAVSQGPDVFEHEPDQSVSPGLFHAGPSEGHTKKPSKEQGKGFCIGL